MLSKYYTMHLFIIFILSLPFFKMGGCEAVTPPFASEVTSFAIGSSILLSLLSFSTISFRAEQEDDEEQLRSYDGY